ncbi:MAG: YihY/virulence factor BrkB family protein [Chloroflexi bacterium]|nr:YihY/virulence factor BrkB family protein [Chloroflexota bacterium]
MNFQTVWPLLKRTYQEWSDDNASVLAAALSYYTAVSIAPLLIIVIAIVGFFYGEQAARGELVAQIQGLIGVEGAKFIQDVIANANKPTVGTIAGLLSLATLIWGSTNVFEQLHSSLNQIWDVEAKKSSGIVATIRERFLSFTLVLGIGFLLLVSLLLSAVLSALSHWFGNLVPGAEWVWEIVNFVISFGVITLLFCLIYKILPDAEIAWRDVWLGAAVTALLFTIGKLVLGLYLGNTSSAYGAAGSLVVFLLWVYYSAQILFLGAEFTQVYSNQHGTGIRPASNAVATDNYQEAHR